MCVFWARSSLLESALRGPGLLGVRRIEGLGGRQQIQDFTKSSLSVFLATEASGSSALRALARPGLDCGPDLNLQRPCHCRFCRWMVGEVVEEPRHACTCNPLVQSAVHSSSKSSSSITVLQHQRPLHPGCAEHEMGTATLRGPGGPVGVDAPRDACMGSGKGMSVLEFRNPVWKCCQLAEAFGMNLLYAPVTACDDHYLHGA